MISRILKPRRFTKTKIAVVAVIAATTVFTLGYRYWAYNGWIEYHLVCVNSDAELYEIDRLPTPKLQDVIEDYENELILDYLEKDRPFYRDGSRFYLRPWYYTGSLNVIIKSTHEISIVALGGKLGVYIPNQPGSSLCSSLIGNRKLYLPDPGYSGKMKYIRSQDFAWFLNFIAPEPEYPPR